MCYCYAGGNTSLSLINSFSDPLVLLSSLSPVLVPVHLCVMQGEPLCVMQGEHQLGRRNSLALQGAAPATHDSQFMLLVLVLLFCRICFSDLYLCYSCLYLYLYLYLSLCRYLSLCETLQGAASGTHDLEFMSPVLLFCRIKSRSVSLVLFYSRKTENKICSLDI